MYKHSPAAARPLNDDELRQARTTWETAMMELPPELADEPTAERDVAMHVLGMYPCVYLLPLDRLDAEADRIRRR